MKVETYEATVENGQIKLADFVRRPEHAKVYGVVRNGVEPTRFYVGSPRLVQPKQAADFVKVVAEEPADAGL
jgi:hypothetical protein